MIPLRALPLAAEGFAPFGRVFDAAALPARPVNQGRGLRRDLPVALAHDTGASGPTLAVYAMAASVAPLPLVLLERHPRSEQAFWPLGDARFLALVAPALADGSPDLGGARAFQSAPGQGIVYGRGVWHMPLAAAGAPGSFLMLQWQTGGPDDCLVHPLADGACTVSW